MIINEISSTLIQRYGENQINAILNRNISYLTHHIKKICEFVYDEGIDISKVQQAFQQYEQLKKQGDAFDYRNLSFSEFVNKLQTLTISVQLPNVIFTSNDKMIQIGRFDTFEEANSFQKQTNITCCFCTNKVWWNIYKGHGAELYIIHNLYQSCKSRLRYVIVVILANKKPYFFDMNDKSLRKERGIEVYSKYIASLNGAERYLLENKNINCNRNMNKKLIRLTESDLHRIVRESVNTVLNEGNIPPVFNRMNGMRPSYSSRPISSNNPSEEINYPLIEKLLDNSYQYLEKYRAQTRDAALSMVMGRVAEWISRAKAQLDAYFL